jgi:hypothetical protein
MVHSSEEADDHSAGRDIRKLHWNREVHNHVHKILLLDHMTSLFRSVHNIYPTIFFIRVCEAIGTAATPGLLCQLRVIVKMIVEKQMECRLARETEVLGENLPQRHFYPSQNPTWPDPGLIPGRRGGKPATNRLSYGAASTISLEIYFNIILIRAVVSQEAFSLKMKPLFQGNPCVTS